MWADEQRKDGEEDRMVGKQKCERREEKVWGSEEKEMVDFNLSDFQIRQTYQGRVNI